MSGLNAPESGSPFRLTPPSGAGRPVRHPEAPAPGTLLGSHYDQCFGCGAGQAAGLRLTARAGEGVTAYAEFTVEAAHQGAPGLAHGGVLVAALDEIVGSLNWLLRVMAVTGRLDASFRCPVPVGATLHLRARCTAVDGRKIYASGVGRIGGPDGPLAVSGDAVLIQVEPEHFPQEGRPELFKAVPADVHGPRVTDRAQVDS